MATDYIGRGLEAGRRLVFSYNGSQGIVAAGKTSFSGPDIRGVPLSYIVGSVNVSIDGFTLDEDEIEYPSVGVIRVPGIVPTTARVRIETLGPWSPADALAKSANLSDVPDKTAARANLGLDQVLHIRDEKTSGTSGGASVAGTQTRVLNTVKINTIPGASLAANQITLPAGTYDIDAGAPGYLVNGHVAWLYNVTAAAVLANGSSMYSNVAVSNSSQIRGRFTLAATSVLEIRHFTNAATATFGLGVPNNSGQIEVYAEAIIRKVS